MKTKSTRKYLGRFREIQVYQLEDDSLMLHNDLYQVNMAESYWNDNIHEKMAVFDLYFKNMLFIEMVMVVFQLF